MTINFDINALAFLLSSAAEAEIRPRFRALGKDDIREKTSAIDLVTEADVAAERFIKAGMDAVLPGALFVGEESVAADPSLLRKLAEADLAVVVDPIDGTFNFAAGVPLFGVMASVVSGGETIAGVIYDPMGDDFVLAEKGAGAWQTGGHRPASRLKAAAAVPLAEMTGMASTGFLPADKRAGIMANLAKVAFASNYRCAAHEYRTFAAGHVHYLMYNKLMPWDHLGGTLISQEAGAYAARFDGSRYLPRHVEGGLLIAPDKDSWEMMRREVFVLD
ncbi:inositol monophosphatase family protein [Mycoplana rhizolycopersici]|uniref:Inositol monophosphatase n=1 Tax=Mycoplana rhizolycopersici TaxID=2746702 RepID=A0ABX2QDF5_9HYPH|nr:inositol monophosphatase family protein [Rhizobium rhizolycopersici]NVP55779.1 inositol monophosphatase [Rhizobium rhizolycopersici]